jgi:hypothetical protein
MNQELRNQTMFEPFITNKSRRIVENLRKKEEKNVQIYNIQYDPKHEFLLKALNH